MSCQARSPSRSTDRFERRAAWRAACLGTLLLLAQAWSLHHRAESSHEVCYEHGELVHVEGLPAPAGSARAARAQADLAVVPLDDPTGPHGPLHEHCDLGRCVNEGVIAALAEHVAAPTPPALAERLPASTERAGPTGWLGATGARAPPALG